jgi:hypothetical protein
LADTIERGLNPTIVSASEFHPDLPLGSCLGWADLATNVITIEARKIAELPGDFAQNVLGVVVHEIAHLLPAQPPLVDVRLPKVRQVYDRSIREVIASPLRTPRRDPAHDMKFYRRCCHAAVRAADAGFEFNLYVLWDGGILPQPPHFICQLLPEALRMRSFSFAQIEATEPPAEFTANYENHITFWGKYR